MSKNFFNTSSLISYSVSERRDVPLHEIKDIKLKDKFNTQWLNCYGLQHVEQFKEIIIQEKLDDFLLKLISDEEHPNKMLQLDELLFVGISVLKPDDEVLEAKQMYFITSSDFVWSIQEHKGNYFKSVRDRLENPKSLTRKKRADYLLYLILECIVDNYNLQLLEFTEFAEAQLGQINNSDTTAYVEYIEKTKRMLFQFKKASLSLRDVFVKLEKAELYGFENKYFTELKEQTINMISDIDFELQELESKLNLSFSMQNSRLNEVMKTLTSYSVIFIPITFITGLYGMNFVNMPELQLHNGYFYILILMAIITIVSLWYFNKRKWL